VRCLKKGSQKQTAADQILREDIRFDPDTGELLTGSFMDYARPLASDLCAIKSNPVPTKTNPLGVKGAGEAGTIGARQSPMSWSMRCRNLVSGTLKCPRPRRSSGDDRRPTTSVCRIPSRAAATTRLGVHFGN